MERSKLWIGNGGWVRYQRSDLAAAAYLRYEDRDGHLEPVELYLEPLEATRIGTDLLREVPIGIIDRWVNAHADSVRAKIPLAGPDLRRAARNFDTTFRNPKRHWVAAMQLAQIQGKGVPQAPMPTLDALEPVEPPSLDAHLDVPAGKPYGDNFYADVAEVYRRVSPWHRAPANLIADDNGVPTTTVHRWVKMARQRGHLEPGRRGKAG